jgi:hypothetical protein
MVTPGRLALLCVPVLAAACTTPTPSNPSSAAPNVTPVALEPGAYTLALCPEPQTTYVITVPGKGTFTGGLALCAGTSNCAAPANVALQVKSVEDGVWAGLSENGILVLTLNQAGSRVLGVIAGSATTVDGTIRVTAETGSAQIAGAWTGSQDLAGRIDGILAFVAPSGGGCIAGASSWTLRPRQ